MPEEEINLDDQGETATGEFDFEKLRQRLSELAPVQKEIQEAMLYLPGGIQRVGEDVRMMLVTAIPNKPKKVEERRLGSYERYLEILEAENPEAASSIVNTMDVYAYSTVKSEGVMSSLREGNSLEDIRLEKAKGLLEVLDACRNNLPEDEFSRYDTGEQLTPEVMEVRTHAFSAILNYAMASDRTRLGVSRGETYKNIKEKSINQNEVAARVAPAVVGAYYRANQMAREFPQAKVVIKTISNSLSTPI